MQVYGQGSTGHAPVRVADVFRTLPRTALGAGASADIWDPGASRKARLLYVSLTTSGATVLTIKIGSKVVLELDMAGAGHAERTLPGIGVIGDANGDRVTVTTSAAVTVGATAGGTEE